MPRQLTSLLVLLYLGVSPMRAEPYMELARFLYEIPVMPGMEEDRRDEQQRLQYGRSARFEYTVRMVTLRAKKGKSFTAEEIFNYYHDYFTKKGFKLWANPPDPLQGRFQAPGVSTVGEASIRSSGHISYWIPEAGSFATFWIQQRRDFSYDGTKALLEEIKAAIEEAAKEQDYTFRSYEHDGISNWPEYTMNECFVWRENTNVYFKEPKQFDCFDDSSIGFTLSIFPTEQHAIQWRNRLMEDYPQKFTHQRFGEKFVMEPTVIRNVVVERGRGYMTRDFPAFRKDLLARLEELQGNY